MEEGFKTMLYIFQPEECGWQRDKRILRPHLMTQEQVSASACSWYFVVALIMMWEIAAKTNDAHVFG